MKETKFNKHNFIPRIIASPFILGILIIAHNLFVLKRFYHFLKFGGEYINYDKPERKTIKDIYEMLQEIKKERETNP